MASKDKSPAGPPIFLPQTYPELRQLSRKAIHLFLKERECYELRVKDALSQGSVFNPVALVNSVDFDLLTSLINLDTFPGVSTISDLTEEILLGWLKEQDEVSLEAITVEELEALVKKSVRMRTKEPDAKIRVMRLFADYQTFLRGKQLDQLTTDNPKIAVKQICSLLRPQALKRKIGNDPQLHQTALKTNWKGFYKYVMEKAVALEEFLPCTDVAPQPPAPGGTEGDKPTRSHYRGYRGRYMRKDHTNNPTGTHSTSQSFWMVAGATVHCVLNIVDPIPWSQQ